MAKRISRRTRIHVAARADHLCEYCLIAEDDTFFGCEIDHILSVKHGGSSESDNLAYAYAFCNRYKGTDIASVAQTTTLLARIFNPRIDKWSDHFRLENFRIEPVTDIGEVTARLLRLNDHERILERQELSKVGRFPNSAASSRIAF
jgi:hypothetical protein